MKENYFIDIALTLLKPYEAIAQVRGSSKYPEINGTVRFYNMRDGVMVISHITGLPSPSGKCESPVFGYHIHSGSHCSGNETDPFADAKTHYNPHNCPHPHHAGDLPPLFGNSGKAFSAVLTDRFSVEEIIGKVIIIHDSPDDFTTQPAGNSGNKIACGVIKRRR